MVTSSVVVWGELRKNVFLFLFFGIFLDGIFWQRQKCYFRQMSPEQNDPTVSNIQFIWTSVLERSKTKSKMWVWVSAGEFWANLRFFRGFGGSIKCQWLGKLQFWLRLLQVVYSVFSLALERGGQKYKAYWGPMCEPGLFYLKLTWQDFVCSCRDILKCWFKANWKVIFWQMSFAQGHDLCLWLVQGLKSISFHMFFQFRKKSLDEIK